MEKTITQFMKMTCRNFEVIKVRFTYIYKQSYQASTQNNRHSQRKTLRSLSSIYNNLFFISFFILKGKVNKKTYSRKHIIWANHYVYLNKFKNKREKGVSAVALLKDKDGLVDGNHSSREPRKKIMKSNQVSIIFHYFKEESWAKHVHDY
ncbi:unnamed protein product [Vicia faba]|uniref:Uncharacterized protein n=1 Tax=Vicia faba TaxID=3906 RepID=A0AAV0ZSY6_VICFA|nr:unnamed protein product [Vicia faba]